MRFRPWWPLALALSTGCVGDEARLSQPAAGAGGSGGGGGGDAQGAGGAAGCAPSELACGALCVDPATDPDHCGGCNASCPDPAHGSGLCAASECAVMCDADALASDDGASCFGCAAATIVEADPLLYWRLGEPSGTSAIDESGLGQHGTYVGVGLGAPGVSSDGDTAAVFGSAVDSRVVRPDFGSFPTSALTVALWLRSADATNEAGLVSYATSVLDNEFLLFDHKSLSIYVAGVPLDTGVALNDGAWHHLAVTWESATGSARVYLDGEQAFEGAVSAGIPLTAGGTLVLGQDQDCLDGCFNPVQQLLGELDEVAIFDRVLSGAEIALHLRTVTCTP